MKICHDCKENKELTEFYKHKIYKDGLQRECKKCRKIRSLAPKAVETRKRYRNSPGYKEHFREYFKEYRLKTKYKLTTNEYNQLLINQKECCKICNRHKSKFKKGLAIDHCHKTGKVRGLLCGPCNKAIGLLQENLETINNAIIYLKYS